MEASTAARACQNSHYWMKTQYDQSMDDLTPCQWIARCAARLGERWRTVPPAELEAVAVEIWRDETLRGMDPQEAAARWLAPVGDASHA